MFIDELTPIFKQLVQHPASFMGGLVSGVLKLNLSEDPVKTWLDKQVNPSAYSSISTELHNGKSNKPQSISIE
ncbi:hypothetical protein [Calothrix sp. 336/3]|uniref:hypothetical protein n=1 Tax=Calothrix sp. 336/3 TaxID=1337936 RepID=UPI0004E2B1D2|nr:hypothetical protein [Calothrix sp. 336/3]AKG24303.1 hypothetical protein IJ00_25965 [Calothrix sp. 336/3]